MMNFICDRFVSNAQVSLLDLGVLRGFGIFEFARTYAGQFFHLDLHLKRFFDSADAIGLTVPYSPDEIKRLCYELMEKNHLSDGSVKMVLTGGASQNGFEVENAAQFALIANTLKVQSTPLKVSTAYYERYLPSCKTLNYLPAILERRKAQAKGFDEALFLDHQQNVLEGARENFFAIRDGVLITPKEGVLPGVTRKWVLDLAKDVMSVEERIVTYAELSRCQEAFFTSTAREIAPIIQIDAMEFEIQQTSTLQQLFKDKVSLVAQM